jgi:hypothetical protein
VDFTHKPIDMSSCNYCGFTEATVRDNDNHELPGYRRQLEKTWHLIPGLLNGLIVADRSWNPAGVGQPPPPDIVQIL